MPFSNFRAAAGGINDDAMLEAMTLCAAIYWNDRVNAANALAALGGGQILLWKYQTESMPPSYAVFRIGDDLMICVPGTTNANQMVANILGGWAVVYPGQTGWAHSFFLSNWQTIKADIDAAMPADISHLNTKWVGHSMGGAVSFFGALDYAQRFGSVRTQYMGFAAAKSLNKDYVGPLPDPCYLVTNNNDGVAYLPPNDILCAVRASNNIVTNSVPVTWTSYKDAYRIDTLGNLTHLGAGGFNFFLNPLLWAGCIDDHMPAQYMIAVENVWDRQMRRLGPGDLVSISRAIRAEPFSQHLDWEIPPGNYVSVPATNELVFEGSPTAPLTPTNLDSVEQLSGLVTSTTPRFSPNIQDFSGDGSMASGLWRITMYINTAAGYGKTESHVWNGGGGSTIAQAVAVSVRLKDQRKKLLGAQAATFGFGTPEIQWIRVSDAVNPRVAALNNYAGSGTGPFVATPAPSDVISTAITFRLIGTTSGTPPVSQNVTVAIFGQPDVCVAQEQYQPAAILGDGTAIDTALNRYLNYLVSNAQQLGFMGVSAAQPKQIANAGGFAPTGMWRWTFTAHGYVSGDRVRLSGAALPGWAGVYKVSVVDANTFDIVSHISGTSIQPKLATFQRIQSASKVKLQDFYRYTGAQQTPYTVKKRNVGKAFTGLSFRHKTRKAA
jgi:hypothetical protein